MDQTALTNAQRRLEKDAERRKRPASGENREKGGIPPWLAELIQKAAEFVKLDAELEKALRLAGVNGSNREPFELAFQLAKEGLPLAEIGEIFFAGGRPEAVREALGLVETAVAAYADDGEEAEEAERKAETILYLLLSSCYRHHGTGQHRWPSVSQSEVRELLLDHFGTAPESRGKDFEFFVVLAAAGRYVTAKRRLRRYGGTS